MASDERESLAWELSLPVETVACALERQGLHVITAEQKAVLDAMAACSTDEVREMRDLGMTPRVAAYAELARREALRGK